MKPLLVGEAPGPRTDPQVPFDGKSGAVLDGLLGRPYDEVLTTRNLLRRWPGNAGKGSRFRVTRTVVRRAKQIERRGGTVIVAGKRAAAAFGLGRAEYFKWHQRGAARIAVMPHPSGVNRWWNESANRARARRWLRKNCNLQGGT